MTIYGLLIWFVKLVCSLEVIVSITLGVIVSMTLGVIVSMITVFFIGMAFSISLDNSLPNICNICVFRCFFVLFANF